jgi:hypothetical protein
MVVGMRQVSSVSGECQRCPSWLPMHSLRIHFVRIDDYRPCSLPACACQGNPIGDQGVQSLAAVLCKVPGPCALDLRGCGIGDGGARNLSRPLGQAVSIDLRLRCGPARPQALWSYHSDHR